MKALDKNEEGISSQTFLRDAGFCWPLSARRAGDMSRGEAQLVRSARVEVDQTCPETGGLGVCVQPGVNRCHVQGRGPRLPYAQVAPLLPAIHQHMALEC